MRTKTKPQSKAEELRDRMRAIHERWEKIRPEYLAIEAEKESIRDEAKAAGLDVRKLRLQVVREVLLDRVGQRVVHCNFMCNPPWLRNAEGTLIEVRRTQASVDFGQDRGQWNVDLNDLRPLEATK